jgi:fructose-1,6-bisphosphatase class II
MSKVTDNYHIYLKATELAAIAAAKLRGNGDGKAADKVATEAMREVLQESNIHTRVVIGEGERDDAPMLYIGEEMGDLSSDLKIDIAVDPLECTNHCAKNLPDALAVLAAAPRGALLHAPDTYMDKLCGSKELIGKLSLSNSVSENLKATSKALNKSMSDLKIIVMDRDRHIDLIREMNLLGVEPILIGDGDVSGGLKAAEGSVDLLYGIGAAPEGVITATAVKAMGGYFEGKLTLWINHLRIELLQCLEKKFIILGQMMSYVNLLILFLLQAEYVLDGFQVLNLMEIKLLLLPK